jgi:hypothetical protein
VRGEAAEQHHGEDGGTGGDELLHGFLLSVAHRPGWAMPTVPKMREAHFARFPRA